MLTILQAQDSHRVMALPQEEELRKGPSPRQGTVEFGVLVPWSVAQKGDHGLQWGTSPWLLRLAAPWRRGTARCWLEGDPFKGKTLENPPAWV